MATTKIVLVLTGGRTGQTCTLAKYPFIQGRLTLQGDTAAMAGVIKYLGRTFKAFPEGSVELAHYQQEDANGQRGVQAAIGQGHPEAAQSGGQSDGKGPQAISTDAGKGAVDSQAGATGVHSGGNGQAASIEEALKLLDPRDNTHWTSNGLPNTLVLSRLMGRQVARSELLKVAPTFERPVKR